MLTKSDAVDADTLEVVRLEVEDYVARIVSRYGPIADRRGQFVDGSGSRGVDDPRSPKLRRKLQPKHSAALARLPVDRVFTMKGFGTVVTGTLVAGTIRKEEELEVFPAGNRVRVRGVQVHGSRRMWLSPANAPL